MVIIVLKRKKTLHSKNGIMKRICNVLLLLLTPYLLSAQGINFENSSLQEALQKAKAENKLLFIDGYATWCGPCKRMDRTVFVDREVGRFFDEHLVAMKVDVEKGEGPEIKRKYGITGLPGYVFLNGDGFVMYRFSSAMSKEAFMEKVNHALELTKDENNIGRLTERYQSEKGDEQFVRLYLDKLKKSNSTNYTDVLENYLSIQKSIPESSKEMVMLLADHSEEIVFGGHADDIIQRNYGTDAWKLYVRKDIREAYQKLPKRMIENTTDYAVYKKDTTILEMVLERAADNHLVKVDEKQRNRVYTFYYEQVGEGEKYKALVHEDNVAFIESIDVEDLRTYYQDWKVRKANGEPKAQYSRPHAVRRSQEVASMVFRYAKFVKTEEEKNEVISWMKVAYDIIPGDANIMSQYANILYTFGKDQKEAIKIKQQAYKIVKKEGGKQITSIKQELASMKKGEKISLK